MPHIFSVCANYKHTESKDAAAPYISIFDMVIASHNIKAYNGEKKYSCLICNIKFTNKGSLKNHSETVHEGKKYNCSICGKDFGQLSDLSKHQKVVHKNMNPEVTANKSENARYMLTVLM